MAIPFLQPEDDEAARLHGSGAGAGHPGSAPMGMMASGAGTGSSGIGVGAGPPTNPIPISFGPLPPPPPMMPGGIAGSPAPSGTGTAVQTPLIGPMNGDQLVHLFYEALYRYSRGDTPSTPISQSPQSSSCSPFTTGYYSGAGISGSAPPISSSQGQVFFPQTPTGLGPPTTPLGVGGGNYRGRVFFGQPTPSPSGSSSHSSQHSGNSPADSNPSCSSAAPI
ncbi:cleavage and polyadenylation specificity factor subunit 6-like [Uranotaenia lowii]|uniref:cleavage and polyadenylation specificity factor subunit 6-like n=1 Tax=Uranotaenia lowii TaxID=190385 RepID=UPI00247AE76E|nr:cleavage and polyadenylation specificity factor subunit 6-like [Uranotaenia lowii]